MAPRRKQSAKNQPPPQPSAESGEEFRLSDIQSDSDVSVNLPSGSAPVRRPPGPYLSGLNWHPDPDPEVAAQDDKSTAADVHYFFVKTKEGTICRVCK